MKEIIRDITGDQTHLNGHKQPGIEDRSVLDNERLAKPFDSDPLQGVILGDTPHDRYVTFMTNVIATIWPPERAVGLIPEDKATGEGREYNADMWGVRTFKDTLVKMMTTVDHPESEESVEELLTDPLGGILIAGVSEEPDLNGYIQLSPNAVDPIDLESIQFERLTSIVGSEYLRVRAVDPELLETSAKSAITGGTCILETRVMGITSEMVRGIELGILQSDNLTNFVRQAVAMSPTITQISGAGLFAKGGTHYNESRMWIERIHEYGISLEEAEQLVLTAYQDINQAILRRAMLIDPNVHIEQVDFDELDLTGELTRWFEELNMEYDDQYKIFHVVGTYVGPEAKQQLNQALNQHIPGATSPQQTLTIQSMIDADYHVRTKQIDHGNYSFPVPIPLVLGLRGPTQDEEDKLPSDYVFNGALGTTKDIYTRSLFEKSPHGRFIGFSDLPTYGSKVAHQDRGAKFNGLVGEQLYLQSIESFLDNPRYLHRGNIDRFLTFLELSTRETNHYLMTQIDEKRGIDALLTPYNKKRNSLLAEQKSLASQLDQAHTRLSLQFDIITLYNYLSDPNQVNRTNMLQTTAQQIIEQIKKTQLSLEGKNEQDRSPEDKSDIYNIKELISVLEIVCRGEEKPKLSEGAHIFLEKVKENADVTILHTTAKKETVIQKLEATISVLTALEENDEYQQLKADRVRIEANMKTARQSEANPLPLSENPFVQLATMFLFDPDFTTFLTHAAIIQQELQLARSPIASQKHNLEQEIELIKQQSLIEITALQETTGVISDEDRLQSIEQEQTIRNESKTKIEATRSRLKLLDEADAAMRGPANLKMKSLMQQIYPKLEAYILYIYGKIEYPTEMRSTKLIAA